MIVLSLALVSTGCERRYHNPGATSLGSTTVNGRVCRYYAADGEVVFTVVFDTQEGSLYINSIGGRMRSGATVEEVEDKFGTLDGHRFAVRYRYPGPVVIDEREYQPDDGRIFLVRLGQRGNECEQLPLSIPRRKDRQPDATYVGEELQKAAARNARLSAFLGLAGSKAEPLSWPPTLNKNEDSGTS